MRPSYVLDINLDGEERREGEEWWMPIERALQRDPDVYQELK